MAVKFFENLSNNYLELLDDKEDFNIVINVGKSPNTKVFQAHSAILRCRSLYFRNELANSSKLMNDLKTIELKKISIQQFEIIIKYIYGGIVVLEKIDASFIFDFMLIACEFLFEELAKHLETHLIEKEAHWLRLNFNRIYQISFQNNKLQKLQKWCNDFLVKHPSKIFDLEEFISLQENALISLISRDDLQMEEVKIWNHVIEWGIAKNPGLPSDPEDCSPENFLALKTTLQHCLPHIRYFQMSGYDIFNYVQPYHQILEKKLWKDIVKKYMTNEPISSTVLPPRIILKPALPTRITESFELFSNVINETHAAEIASWVDRKVNQYSVRDNPYEFKLLLRGTRDGFTKDSFWNICDKQTDLVVVMKVKGTDEILGGYNPVGWDKPITNKSGLPCNDSFVFSLRNGTIQNSILSRVKEPERAISCSSSRGPIFGHKFWPISADVLAMNDKFNQDKGCLCRKSSIYEKLIRNESTYDENERSFFSVEEYEIFQINNYYAN